MKCPHCGTILTRDECQKVKQELQSQVNEERKKEIDEIIEEHETEIRSPLGEKTSASKIAIGKTAKNAPGNRCLKQTERRFTKDQLQFTEDNSEMSE